MSHSPASPPLGPYTPPDEVFLPLHTRQEVLCPLSPPDRAHVAHRARVAGGWLYFNDAGMAFVPDRQDTSWDGLLALEAAGLRAGRLPTRRVQPGQNLVVNPHGDAGLALALQPKLAPARPLSGDDGGGQGGSGLHAGGFDRVGHGGSSGSDDATSIAQPVPPGNGPDFYARATEQLRTADGDDTVVIATMNGERMHLQTRAPRGAAELVHIARRILDDALEQAIEAEAAATTNAEAEPHETLRIAIEDALASLPDPDADDEGEG